MYWCVVPARRLPPSPRCRRRSPKVLPMRKPLQFLLAPLASAILAACAVGPDYQAPQTPAAQKFDGLEATTYSTDAAPTEFWRGFADPVLERLVDDALRSNHD